MKYKTIFEEKQTLNNNFSEFTKYIQERFENFSLYLFKKKNKKSKIKDFKKLNSKNPNFVNKIYSKYVKFYTGWAEKKIEKEKELEQNLNNLANSVNLSSSGENCVIVEISDGAYSSQGYGASKYAMVAAQSVSLDLISFGIENKFEKVVDKYEWGDMIRWRVSAKLDAWQIDCFNRKSISVEQKLRRQISLGVNPLVYNPYYDLSLVEKIWKECPYGESYEDQYKKIKNNLIL